MPTKTQPSILIVDDVPANRLALKRLLGKVDAELLQAGSGNEALVKAVQEHNLALILLDVQMPDMDGYEVARFLREEPQTRNIPIIFVTAVHSDEQHVLKGYGAGAIDYISKPIVPEILMSKVRIFLQLWQLRADLEQANETAEAAAAAKNRFLSTMSHEIRTPMNGVLGVAELLSATALNKQQHQYVDTILNSGELLMRILNDILDCAKLEAGKVMLELIPFNLETVGKEVLQLLAANSQKAQLQLIFDYPPQSPRHFIGDPARLRQILFNLLGNAIKFTKQGYVRLAVQVTSASENSTNVMLTVEDTGIGISNAEQKYLFEAFSQADASIARKFGGSGLGLTICRQLTHLMGGQIGVKSQHGKGAVFEVSLSLAPTTAPLQPAHQANPDTLQNSLLPQFDRHLLLVEDTPINQMVAIAMLEKLGVKVTLAEDGLQAVEQWRKLRIDLIFMDCNMPVMDGFEATRIIRAEESADRHIPIIALTANATRENDQQCELAGMDDVATKPFNIATLSEILIKWLNAQ